MHGVWPSRSVRYVKEMLIHRQLSCSGERSHQFSELHRVQAHRANVIAARAHYDARTR